MNYQSSGTNTKSKGSIKIMLAGLLIIIIILVFVNYSYLYSYKSGSYKYNVFKQDTIVPLNPVIKFDQNLDHQNLDHQNLDHQNLEQQKQQDTVPEFFAQNPPINTNNVNGKNDKPEQGIVKLAIYHMDGCGHCHAIMHRSGNDKSLYEKLKDNYANDPKVKIYDFMAGRDKEADVYRFLPVIKIITINSSDEYNGPRDYNSIVEAINKKK